MRRLTPADWAVLADRLQVAGDPRGHTLALGLSRDPAACTDLNPACEVAPMMAAHRWPVTLLCPALDAAARMALYGVLRPAVERTARTRLTLGGGPATIARHLRRRPARTRRRVGRGRPEALITLANCVDPAVPPRWAWAACRQLIRGDMLLIDAIARLIEHRARLAVLLED